MMAIGNYNVQGEQTMGFAKNQRLIRLAYAKQAQHPTNAFFGRCSCLGYGESCGYDLGATSRDIEFAQILKQDYNHMICAYAISQEVWAW